MGRDRGEPTVLVPLVVAEDAHPNALYVALEELQERTWRFGLAMLGAARPLRRDHLEARHAGRPSGPAPCHGCAQWERIRDALRQWEASGPPPEIDLCATYAHVRAVADELLTAVKDAAYNIEDGHEAAAHLNPDQPSTPQRCPTCALWDVVRGTRAGGSGVVVIAPSPGMGAHRAAGGMSLVAKVAGALRRDRHRRAGQRFDGQSDRMRLQG